jgi:hypothetical protein
MAILFIPYFDVLKLKNSGQKDIESMATRYLYEKFCLFERVMQMVNFHLCWHIRSLEMFFKTVSQEGNPKYWLAILAI